MAAAPARMGTLEDVGRCEKDGAAPCKHMGHGIYSIYVEVLAAHSGQCPGLKYHPPPDSAGSMFPPEFNGLFQNYSDLFSAKG